MSSQTNTTAITFTFLIGVLLGLGVVYAFTKPATAPVVGGAVATSTASTTTRATASTTSSKGLPVTTLPGGVQMVGQGKVEMVPVAQPQSIPAPSATKPLVFGASIPAEMKTVLNTRLAAAQSALAKNRYDFNAWMDLALTRKMAGDLAGAREVWEYANKVWPQNIIAYANLGDLYQNFLNDYAKAEANYKKALANDPQNTSLYRALFDLYANTSYKPSATAAVDIVKQGIVSNPAAIDLHILLARYYVKTGDKALARTEYEEALRLAKEQGNTPAEKDIAAELSLVK